MMGVSNMESLGELYQNNSEVFYQTTKIAISNNIDQEYYAAVTWVEATAASLTEQIGAWLENDQKINNDVMATALLAGIIEQTQSFRDPKTTPNTLELASKLIKHGAKQQEIIQHLFKTKPFNLLQLWGRAMARVQVNPENTILYSVLTKQQTQSFRDPKTTPNTLELASKLIKHGAKQQEIIQHLFKTKPFNLLQLWGRAMARVQVNPENTILYSVLTKQDFEKTHSSPQILTNVLKELVTMASSYQLVVLIAELENGVEVELAAPPHVKLKSLARLFDQDFSNLGKSLRVFNATHFAGE
jgi:nanoRNase/pAp phosphatase (c-di-AMP/oligoRNAs hydrolase)